MRVALWCTLYGMETFIYYVRPGENEELRLSLRSVAKCGPAEVRIVIIGDPPEWVNRDLVTVLEGNALDTPAQNAFYNLKIACTYEPGDFWSFNDDFILLAPWPEPFPTWFWKSIIEHHNYNMRDPRTVKRKALFKRTLDYLQSLGIKNPMHYELHIPMKINGTEMLRILDEAFPTISEDTPPIWRTLYGNLSTLYTEPHVQREDVKHHSMVTVPPRESMDFLSTDEKTVDNLLPMLHSEFPDPSPWEV